MLEFEKLKIRNFMSFGNIEHSIALDKECLVLIKGENRDVMNNGSSTDSANGTGKSSIVAAIAFALYDRVLGNVKKDNLVNKLNEKNMVVTLDFSKDSNRYRIIRGRKPNILKLFINDKEYEENTAQGENRDTQSEIQKIIGMNFDLFKQIITLSAIGGAFLDLRVKEQRDIIEELLGVTLISQKADRLKELLKDTQRNIESETFKLKTLTEMNDKTLSQITRLQKLSTKWNTEHITVINEYKEAITLLENIDITHELSLHELNKAVMALSSQYMEIQNAISANDNSKTKAERKLKTLQNNMQKSKTENKCYTCGQGLDDSHGHVLDDLTTEIKTIMEEIDAFDRVNFELLNHLGVVEADIMNIGEIETPFYKSEKEAWDHQISIENIKSNLERELIQTNPYDNQIEALKSESLNVIDDTIITKLKEDKDHQDFLLKLLTNKDSFIRKKIVDQSLPFLNARLDHYLSELGLPHTVRFQNDLSVNIDLLGREYDFDNLSRGQKTRLIISLNFAFRDIFETLNYPVSMMVIDELIDNGLDGAGVENAIRILKDMSRNNKTVFLVSHKEEIKPRVDEIVTVIMENGFSQIETEGAL